MIDTFHLTILSQKQTVDEGCHSNMVRVGQGAEGELYYGAPRTTTRSSSFLFSTSTSKNKKEQTLGQSWPRPQEEGMGLPLPPRKVSFAKTCKLRFGLALADYTDEEIKACWYSLEDVKERRRKSMLIVLKMRRGEGGRYCVRGLESMIPEVATERSIARRTARYTVLREQENQRLTLIYSPEAIARKYRKATARDCQVAAWHMGHEDAVAAMKANSQGVASWKQMLRRHNSS